MMPEGHQAQHEIHMLLECTAVQQAEISVSRRHNASQHVPSAQHDNDAFVL
jgi:hypothetical protein